MTEALAENISKTTAARILKKTAESVAPSIRFQFSKSGKELLAEILEHYAADVARIAIEHVRDCGRRRVNAEDLRYANYYKLMARPPAEGKG